MKKRSIFAQMKRLAFLVIILLAGLNWSFSPSKNSYPVFDETGTRSMFTDGHINYYVPLSQLLPHSYDRDDISILIQKNAYTLFFQYRGSIIKSYPCVFGADPVNDKRMRGDTRTPEGEFRISEIVVHELWGYFLGIDYPNYASWNKHIRAKELGRIPDNANIGGDVGIHGTVEVLNYWVDSRNNWTDGCVALKSNDLEEIVQFSYVGMPVKIV